MKTQPIVVGLLLLAGAVLAAGVFYYGGLPAGEMPKAEGVATNTESTTGEETEGFVDAAKASVKKSGDTSVSAGPQAKAVPEKNPREREDYLNSVFRPMAARGVAFAMAQMRQLPDAASRDMAMLALLGEWSGQSVTELAQSGEIGRFGVAGALALHLMNEGQLTPEQTASMANEFLSGSERVGVLGRAAEKLAATDPTAALAMGEGLSDWEQVRFLSRFVAGWASVSPQEARAWASQVSDERTRSVLLGRVLGEQVKADPVGAAQTFAEAPPEDGRVRMRTARQIASSWAGQDTLAAMQWADSLPEESDRNAARDGIRSVAPVGIGARLGRSEDGLPVLEGFVPGGPASLNGQLRVGDRVVAVSDANGSWVNSRNLPIGDVVRLIQGEAKTQVSLQVQSADGESPRVVTLGREQVIHRPGG